jgi:hypothetical protein
MCDYANLVRVGRRQCLNVTVGLPRILIPETDRPAHDGLIISGHTRFQALAVLIQDSIAARAASRIHSLIRNKPEARQFYGVDGMALHRFHGVQGGRALPRSSRKLYFEYQFGSPAAYGTERPARYPRQGMLDIPGRR